MNGPLCALKERLSEIAKSNIDSGQYHVPALWLDSETDDISYTIPVKPAEFFLAKINEIFELSATAPIMPGDKPDGVYNMLVRYTTAFDHDGDSALALPLGKNGWRETGTFIKAIALLPYIRSLKCNIVYLLPITAVGIDERKGSLGSPYSIRDPYKLEESLSEPQIGLGAEAEFSAFIEAAHLLGMKVILEFVFRTASLDSNLALEHPDWFYWIKASIQNRRPGSTTESKYGPPIFLPEEIELIKNKIECGDFDELPKPNKGYRSFFTNAPVRVARVDGKIRGLTESGIQVKIPCGFADWPPDDSQPVWSDVTYLKLFDHHRFNYIAYNTVRMYDNALTKLKNRTEGLWESISGILPYYVTKFGIDGVMVDMGHALPPELRRAIVENVRKVNPDFIFWEENFMLSEKSAEEGYSAVAGYLPFDQHVWWKVMNLLRFIESGNCPVRFFATPETHNTPRAAGRVGGEKFSRIAWLINCFMPSLTFIHSGFELGEKQPVNTGLGFEPEELKLYPNEKLPLFSASSLNWTSSKELLSFIKETAVIRDEYIVKELDLSDLLIEIPSGLTDYLIAYSRKTKFLSKNITIVANMNESEVIHAELSFSKKIEIIKILIGTGSAEIYEGRIRLRIPPFGYLCLETELEI